VTLRRQPRLGRLLRVKERIRARRAGSAASALARPAIVGTSAESKQSQPAILRPGRNCWRLARARHASVLVDAGPYFRRLEQVFRAAKRSIMIIGWDFDAGIRLCPDDDDKCLSLGDFLRSLVERESELEIRVLVWSFSVLHAPSAPLPALLGATWQDHPRIRVELDTHHPLYAAHHQKIVTVDDAIAFVGGIDLTVERWDSTKHAPDDPVRRCADGSIYPAVHDIQMAVDDEAAAAIALLARGRWYEATGEALPPVENGENLWPSDLAADFSHIDVAVSRTRPTWDGHPGTHEVAALTVDALRAARHSIYIEAQYLAAYFVGELLSESLARPHGPEIVIVVTRASRSPVEQWVMGNNRDRLLRRLKRADRFDRLRVYYPVVPNGEKDCDVLIHSKLVIVDDTFLRVGSANLNNRSMGLDTECDLAIEAAATQDRKAIAGLRERLLAEHLGVPDELAAPVFASAPSLIAAIERLNHHQRGLRPFDKLDKNGPTRPVFGTGLLDPARPFGPSWFHRRTRSKPSPTTVF
jgi:phosphatidylserine/phosphatidylglycerophosphate/cardiolipin synthase-like enzyme